MTIVIVVAVVVVVLAIIIAVVVVLVFRKRQVSNCDESSLYGSSQGKNMGQKERPRHNSRMPRKPSHAQKESYGPLEA